jgi:hypothetical protein
MGNEFLTAQQNPNLGVPATCKLYSTLPITTFIEEEEMKEIISKREKLAECPFICTVRGYDFVNDQSGHLICSLSKKLVVYYDYFDYRLIDVPLKNYSREFNES